MEGHRMKSCTNHSASEEASLHTHGDYARAIGRELLAAHQRLDAARVLLLSWRARACDEDWGRALPPSPEVRHD
jgi:hypothetical protein